MLPDRKSAEKPREPAAGFAQAIARDGDPGNVRRTKLARELSGKGSQERFEVFLDRVPEPKRRRRATPDFPALQPVRRDFAFLVAATTPAEALLRAARGAERTLIAEARLFDVFQGGTLPPEQKSVGIELVFQPRERTLTDAEIEAASAKVVAAVAKATGAALR